MVTGVYGPVSASAGTFRFITDGFRDNFSIEHDIHNLFMQAALSPEFNVQFEARRRISKEGDLDINFDPTIFTDNRRELDQDILRFGARYSPGAGCGFPAFPSYAAPANEFHRVVHT